MTDAEEIKDPFLGETFESKDSRDRNRRVFAAKKVERKINRNGEAVVAYICHPTSSYGGIDYKHQTTISAVTLKKRWQKVSH